MMCLDCKFVEIVRDNHDETHSICVCQESDHFLNTVSLVFDGCEYEEKEEDEEGEDNG